MTTTIDRAPFNNVNAPAFSFARHLLKQWREPFDNRCAASDGVPILPGNKSKIIAVESNAAALKDLESKLSQFHVVVGTTQLERALSLLQSERDAAALLVSTAKGADVLGVLAAAQQLHPNVLRVLLTAFENLTLVVEGLHSGAVQRVVSKPIQYAELLAVIRAPNDVAPATKIA